VPGRAAFYRRLIKSRAGCFLLSAAKEILLPAIIWYNESGNFSPACDQGDIAGLESVLLLMRCVLVAVFGAALSVLPASGQNTGKAVSYSVRPPPLAVPSGEPGAVRRSIMQFYHWTLLCDTVFANNTQVCNVSQAVWNDDNAVIFSWSLAASDKGDPFMLLRTAPGADTKSPVRLAVKDSKQSIDIAFVGCNDNVCVAQTPVGPLLTQAIRNRSDITISYRLAGQGTVRFDTSFLGLKEAVAAIK